MADQEREIEMLTPTTRSGRASSRGADQKSVQQSPDGSPAEYSTVESQDQIAKKRRLLPLAAAATLGLVAALSMSGGPETANSPDLDPDLSSDTDDGVGAIDPVELNPPLVDGIDVGPESLQLVAPIGEFVGIRDRVLSRYGQGGPSEYSVILQSSTSDLRLIDLGTGAESLLPDQRNLLLSTDRFIVGFGPHGANSATWLTELNEAAVADTEDDAESPLQGDLETTGALKLGDYLNATFAAESADEFWTVVNHVDHQLLQLRRLPEGEVVQEFRTPILSWRFSGGIPIGSTDEAPSISSPPVRTLE